MSDVFISYSRQDQAFVHKLEQGLNNLGFDVWVDYRDIPSTVDWWLEIEDGIKNATNFIFVISPSSITSKVCRREIEYGADNHKRFVPLLFIDPPKKEEISPIISSLNWISFVDEREIDNVLLKLSDALKTDLDYLTKHKQFLVRADTWGKKGGNNIGLLMGKELDEAEKFLSEGNSKLPSPTKLQSDFIYYSRRIATYRQRRWLLTASLALVVISILAIVAVIQSMIAARQRDEAKSFAWTVIAENLDQQGDVFTPLNLLIRANSIPDPPLASQRALASIAYRPSAKYRFATSQFPVNSVAFHPDGHLALSGGCAKIDATGRCTKGLLTLWDLDKGGASDSMLAHDDWITQVAFTPDGQQFISASEDHILILWDVKTRGIVRKFQGHLDGIESMAISPNGRILASGSCSKRDSGNNCIKGEIIIWDVTSGNILRKLDQHRAQVTGLAFSPDGKRLVSSSWDRSLIFTDMDTGETKQFDTGEMIWSVVFAPNGNDVFFGTQNDMIDVWGSSENRIDYAFEGHSKAVTSIVLSPDKKILASASQDGKIILWDLEKHEILHKLIGHGSWVRSIAFSRDGKSLISGSSDKSVIVWDITQGNIQYDLPNIDGLVTSVAFSPDGKTILDGDANGKMSLRDADTGNLIRDFAGHTSAVRKVLYSSDGKSVISGSDDGTLAVWDINTGQLIRRLIGNKSDVLAAAISPDGKFVLSGSCATFGTNHFCLQGEIILWQVQDGKILHVFHNHQGWVRSLAFSPDGQTFASGGADGSLALWNVTAGQIMAQSQVGTAILDLAFSHNGKEIISAASKEAGIWKLPELNIENKISMPVGTINAVAFSHDDSRILVGTDQGNMTLFDGTSRNEIQQFEGPAKQIQGLAFSPNNDTILTGGCEYAPPSQACDTGGVTLWRLHTLDELIHWTIKNRFIPLLTCDQIIEYDINFTC